MTEESIVKDPSGFTLRMTIPCHSEHSEESSHIFLTKIFGHFNIINKFLFKKNQYEKILVIKAVIYAKKNTGS